MTVDCPFCHLTSSKILFSNDLAIAVEDGFPVSRGHSLIIPKRHIVSIFESSAEERAELWDLLDRTREYLLKEYAPEGFNVGVNDGSAAGQTVMHMHIHLIPRYAGDTEDPRGGVRWIMPEKAPYWKNDG